MDAEKSISELIKEAREDNNKLIVLLAGEATEKSMLAIARVANKIKEEIVFISVDPQKVLADIKEIAQFKDIIVCVDDINSAMMNIPYSMKVWLGPSGACSASTNSAIVSPSALSTRSGNLGR